MTNLDISRVLIVGASGRAAAESARRGGYQVFVGDLFADSDTRKSASCEILNDYPHDIIRVVKRVNPDAVCLTGALENYPSVLEQITKYSRLLAPPIHAIKAVRCPQQFGLVLKANGFTFPRIVENQSPTVGRWLAKPFKSAAGHQIQFIQPRTVCPANYYLQQFVEGRSMSAGYLLQKDKTTLLGTSQLLDLSSQSNFHFQGAVTRKLSPQIEVELVRLGDLLRDQNLRGLIGVDFILTAEKQLVILEVNPRYTATMELYEERWQLPLVDYHIKSFEDPNYPLVVHKTQPVCGKQIIYTGRSVKVSKKLLMRLSELVNAKNFYLSDIPLPGTVIEAEQPVLTIQGKGKTTDKLKDRLSSLANSILQLLLYY